MPRVVKRPLAETDLDEIWWYIAQDNPDSADHFLDQVEERCWTLAQFPNMGRGRDALHPGLRSLPVGKYLIFYVAIEDGIEVVRVLHAMMEIDAFF